MSEYISDALRVRVTRRASYQCEYCRIPDSASFFTFHIDHIVSLIRVPIRFYNPRIDVWSDHFTAQKTGLSNGETDIGRATIKMLELNHPDAIIERRELVRRGYL